MKREAGVGQGFLDHSGMSAADRGRGNGNTGGQGPCGSGQGRDSSANRPRDRGADLALRLPG